VRKKGALVSMACMLIKNLCGIASRNFDVSTEIFADYAEVNNVNTNTNTNTSNHTFRICKKTLKDPNLTISLLNVHRDEKHTGF